MSTVAAVKWRPPALPPCACKPCLTIPAPPFVPAKSTATGNPKQTAMHSHRLDMLLPCTAQKNYACTPDTTWTRSAAWRVAIGIPGAATYPANAADSFPRCQKRGRCTRHCLCLWYSPSYTDFPAIDNGSMHVVDCILCGCILIQENESKSTASSSLSIDHNGCSHSPIT